MFSSFTPQMFVAAAVPFGKQPPEEVAYHSAAAGLDDENLQMVFSVHQGYVYFIAARAQDFLAHPAAATPLAAALPGMPGHHGDGAYICELEHGLYGVLIKQDESLKSLVANEADALAFAVALDATVHRLERSEHARPWRGYRTALLDKARAAAKGGIWVGSLTAAVLLGLLVILSVVQARQKHEGDQLKDELRQSLQQVSATYRSSSVEPVMNLLGDIQKVSSVALQGNGRIVLYQMENGHTAYELEFPATTQAAVYRPLGAGLVVTAAANGKTFQVKKGNPGAAATKTAPSGPDSHPHRPPSGPGKMGGKA